MTLEELFNNSFAHDSMDGETLFDEEDFLRRVIEKDDYIKGNCDLSTTQIIGPPQATYLKSIHGEALPTPYKVFATLSGTAYHKLYEGAAKEKEIAEHRFYHGWNFPGKINPETGKDWWVLGGQMDLASGVLTIDWKTTHSDSYKIVEGEVKKEHWAQCQINAWLANNDPDDLIGGRHITRGGVHYTFRNWSRSKALRGQHPEMWCKYREFDIIDADVIENEIILPMMNDHIDALLGGPRPCTADERWQKTDMWAVIKFGATRAYRTFQSEEEARACSNKMKKPADYMIEFRPGECVRCQEWCHGSVCPQYQEILKKKS